MNALSPNVAVVGGGPAGLIAASMLAGRGIAVDLFDAMPSVGRKFLLAGRGGLNLTHSEPLEPFLARYGKRATEIGPHVRAFPPDAWRAFVHDLGIATFVGTSGRVFPTDFKAAPMLRAWVHRLRESGVRFHARHRLVDVGPTGRLTFDTPEGRRDISPAASILALGGASWPHLGSDAAWVPLLRALGAEVRPLVPSNCGFEADWSPHLRERWAGAPLKNVAVSFAGRTVRGEIVLADYGLEGGAIYALSGPLRDSIAQTGTAELRIDLKPDLGVDEMAERLNRPRGSATLARHLQKAVGLAGPIPSLLREVAPESSGDPRSLAAALKALPVVLRRPRPVEEAISSAGGVPFEELTGHLMLRRVPGLFLAGEMLDWEAPTGGYLLQACVATGAAAADGAAIWVANNIKV